VIWVGWRQQRTETLIAAAVVAVLAVVAVPIGLHMASVYSHDGLSGCTGGISPGSACGTAVPSFMFRFNAVNILFTWSTLLAPLAALLLAAPFVLDLDSGTYRLFWTQSITRRHWTVVKLGMAVASAVVVALLLSILAGWARAPLDHLNGRMASNTYDAEGVVPVAYALFTLGVAVALGAVWRRTVPALLAAFVLYVAMRTFMDSWLRNHLLHATTAIWRVGSAGPKLSLDHDLVISQYLSDRHGHPIPGANEVCVSAAGGLPHTSTARLCVSPNSHDYMKAVYIPASRFWDLQAVEFGIVAGIGILLVLAAGWWTQRRIS
jgi:hypothetical protein